MASTKKPAKKDHPKTEVKKEERASAPERRGLPSDAELVVGLRMKGGVAQIERTVAQVTLGNPTNMAAVIQDMRDELERYF